MARELSQEQLETIRSKLSLFNFGQIQDMLLLMGILAREGIPLSLVKAYVKQTEDDIKRRAKISSMTDEQREAVKKLQADFAKTCPKCGSQLAMMPLRENDERGKTIAVCVNKHAPDCQHGKEENMCDYEEFMEQSIQEMTDEYWEQFDKILEGEKKDG